MKKSLFLAVVAILFLFLSCKKSDPLVVFTGRILHANDSSSYSNAKFVLYVTQESSSSVKKVTQEFYTDQNGSFKVEIIPKSQYVSICYPDLITHSSELIVGQAYGYTNSYDFGVLYAKR